MAASKSVSDVSITSSISATPIPPTPFIPGSSNLFPKWPSQIDAASWDEWQFQAMSADGNTAVAVVFFRHTGNAPAGFRVGINASWAKSNEDEQDSVWCGPVLLPQSIITEEATKTTGIWRTEDNSESISFEISSDLSEARISLNVPGKVTGSLRLKSKSTDIPQTEEETRASIFWWMSPISSAGVDADLTFFPQTKGTIEKGMTGYGEKGRQLNLKCSEGSFGSFDRAWAASPPHKALSHNWFVWGKAGDYMISLIWMTGKPASEGLLHGTATLYHGGKLLCKTGRAVTACLGEEEAFSLTYLEGEGLAGNFPPHNVGNRIVFQKGEKSWEFEFRHQRLWYDMIMGPPRPGATGVSGFIVSISGGRVGLKEEEKESEVGWGMLGGGIMP